MADSLDVASRLHKFTEAAQEKVKTGPVQREYRQYMRAEPGPEEILKVYQKCLDDALTDQERAALDCIVMKMSGALHS
jgi:hypothetical protein